jgi:hypothetical protein
MMDTRKNFFTRNRNVSLISGAFSTLLYLFFIIEEAVRDFFKIQTYELIIFYPRMGIGILGYLIGWVHAKMGGVLMIASGMLMASYVINNKNEDVAALVALFLLSYFIPGVLILISDFKRRTGN